MERFKRASLLKMSVKRGQIFTILLENLVLAQKAVKSNYLIAKDISNLYSLAEGVNFRITSVRCAFSLDTAHEHWVPKVTTLDLDAFLRCRNG